MFDFNDILSYGHGADTNSGEMGNLRGIFPRRWWAGSRLLGNCLYCYLRPNRRSPGIESRLPNLKTPGISELRFPNLNTPGISFLVIASDLLPNRNNPGISESRFPNLNKPGRALSSRFGLSSLSKSP